MPAQLPLYQEVYRKIYQAARKAGVRKTTIVRLALLVVGIVVAKNVVTPIVASELFNLKLTQATSADSIQRRIRRTLNDKSIDAKTCYEPVLLDVIDWQGLLKASKRILLIVDESSKEDEVHLFRVSLGYWGTSQPLAWEIWQQNEKLPAGAYWSAVDRVLDRVAALIPTGLEVIVEADRAYDNPPFVDKIKARGWHWIVRFKANSSTVFRNHQGRELPLRSIITIKIPSAGKRWKERGFVFKDAGWRQASVVGIWASGEKEALVVITDLRCQWEIAHWYRRRFWIEAGFRNDKKRGWQWEDSQVKDLDHQGRLLVAMAFATLIVMCIGVQEAKAHAEKLASRAVRREAKGKAPAKPQHARHSVFTMGLRRASAWFYRTADRAFQWVLPDIDSKAWNEQCLAQQSNLYIAKTVRP